MRKATLLLLLLPTLALAQGARQATALGQSDGTSTTKLTGAIPAGTNTIGAATLGSLATTPFSAVSATGTATSSSDSVSGYSDVVIGATYSGITGSPTSCILTVQYSVDNTNFVNEGGTISLNVSAASPQVLYWSNQPSGPFGPYIRYVFTCGGYASGGTFTVKAYYSPIPWSSVVTVQGLSSNGGAAQSNIFQSGAQVNALGSAPSALTPGNSNRIAQDTQNRLYVNTSHPNYFFCTVSAQTSITSCQAAPGSGSLYITDLQVSNGGTAQTVQLVSGTTTTNPCDTSQAAVTAVFNLAVNGNEHWNLQTPIKLPATKQLCCKQGGSTAFSCNVSGFTAP